MKAVKSLVLAVAALIVLAAPVMAQEKGTIIITDAKVAAASKSDMIGLAAGLGAGLVIIGAAIGFGKIGAAALESMARQPETAGRVQTAMIIIGALLEGATFFGLIVCITVAGKIVAP